MTQALQSALSSKLPKTYSELVALHVPRPINDKVSYDNTVAVIDALAGRELNRDQDDYLEILSNLVETYEKETLPAFPKISGVKLLEYLMEQNEMSADDLGGLLDVDRSVAYKILKGTRSLTADHIRKLCGRFAVSADLFL